MRNILCLAAGALVCLGALAGAAPQAARPAADGVPTFTKDVAPILYKNCTSCHRPGEIAPMSLLTYDDVRPHARDIRDKIDEGAMPPWHADMPQGTFLNERGLTPAEKNTILRWVANGAPKGDPKDLPPMPQYPQGWSIGTPDVVLEMQEDYKIPADGMIEYEYFYIPTNFTEAKWVQAIEVRPGNREVVHHVLVNYKVRPDQRRPAALKFNDDLQKRPAADRRLAPARPTTYRRASSRRMRPARIPRCSAPAWRFASSRAA